MCLIENLKWKIEKARVVGLANRRGIENVKWKIEKRRSSWVGKPEGN